MARRLQQNSIKMPSMFNDAIQYIQFRKIFNVQWKNSIFNGTIQYSMTIFNVQSKNSMFNDDIQCSMKVSFNGKQKSFNGKQKPFNGN